MEERFLSVLFSLGLMYPNRACRGANLLTLWELGSRRGWYPFIRYIPKHIFYQASSPKAVTTSQQHHQLSTGPATLIGELIGDV